MALIGQAYRDEEEDEVLSDLDGDEDIGRVDGHTYYTHDPH